MSIINKTFKDIKGTESYLNYLKQTKMLNNDSEYKILKEKLKIAKENNHEEYYVIKKKISIKQEDVLKYKNEIIDIINEIIKIIEG